MMIAIVDYGSGTLRSAAKAFEAASEVSIASRVLVTDRAEEILQADYIVLPGVGSFGDCLAGLNSLHGVRAAMQEAVIVKGKPFMGICVGMQLMATKGTENGYHLGLDWIKGEVIALSKPELKVPHMGWNELRIRTNHPVLDDFVDGKDVYFVHSYHLTCENEGEMLADTDYGGTVCAVVGRENMIGTQFHPEKSQAVGLKFISNFLSWRP
jgi:glutamine amidotransferase